MIERTAHRLILGLGCGSLLLVCGRAGALGPIQFDSGDPTPAEQRVLESINRARSDPAAEGQRLGININEGVPGGGAVARPPLAMNKILLSTARLHSQDMYARKYFEHTDPDGHDPFDRMDGAGYGGGVEGENIAASSDGPASTLEDLLMRDPNYPGRGHRVNLLDIGSTTVFREIGVGYAPGLTGITGSSQPGVNGLKDFLTQDFGTNSTGPFVLGVVYDDTNLNGSYDAGEGLAGVTVMPSSGNFFAVTGAAGGYAFPVATSGSLEITASGGALAAPVHANVTLTGVNVKVDFLPAGATGGGGSMSLVDTDGDGFPDEVETAAGTSPGNSGDTPFGGAPASPLPLTVPGLTIHLNFAASAKDGLTLSCRVPIPAGFDPDGKNLVVDVGGVVRQFVLDAKGLGGLVPNATARLTVKRVKGAVNAQNAKLTFKVSKDSLAAALADEGLANVSTHGPASVSVPTIVILGQSFFSSAKPLRYRAKTGKSGAAK